MTDAEQREAARQFYQKWAGRGNEDEDDRSYWIDFLQDVMGVDHATDRIEFQKKVLNDKGHLSNRIDAYIPETRVLIEQKSYGIDLSKPQPQHGNKTPYEQAKDYDNTLPVSEKAKWIIVSNFAEIWVYDMDTRKPEPRKFTLEEIPSKYSIFEFLINKEQKKISAEEELSMEAGQIVGQIYDAFLKESHNPDDSETLKNLNMLCVRLVFCLYAEDAKLFGTSGRMFHDYMDQFKTEDMRKALKDLFEILNTPVTERDEYDTSMLSQFPYVNGGLFADTIKIPPFTEEIRDALLNRASEGFDWSRIDCSIFGALFESTLNPETRRSGGMHFTSLSNLTKVISPLFLNDLKAELEEILSTQVVNTKKKRLEAFQDKLSKLTFLDPAAGSGNFLSLTYTELRRLENKAIRAIFDCDRKQIDGQIKFLDVINPIKVSIEQFYGIEINDYAVSVAKTAFWIAESQMMKETENILAMNIDFLPLKTQAHIIEGNALQMDWEKIIPKNRCNYLVSNPPFYGARLMGATQKKDITMLFQDIKNSGNLDYVTGWYKKASDYISSTNIECAFVSTNSITQGEQAALLWKHLFNKGISINFAYRSFKWDSEAINKATLHCVIIGFSSHSKAKKYIYSEENQRIEVTEINAYLADAPMVFITSRKKPISPVPEMDFGSMANDGGYLSDYSEDAKNEIIEKYPAAEKMFKRFLGATEFLHNKKRWCLWLKGVSPEQIKSTPPVYSAVTKVKELRSNSGREATRKLADTPTLFGEIRQPEHNYLLIPRHSSENRRYIPIGYIDKDTICGDANLLIPNATPYLFGVITSNVHMSWLRAVCGRLEMRYRYSNTIVYNNFPWPSPTDEQKKKIEETAQGILDARALYPDSSLADLYDPLTMPPKLQKAHTENDRAVMKSYGFNIKDMSEADCVAALMKMYQKLTDNEK